MTLLLFSFNSEKNIESSQKKEFIGVTIKCQKVIDSMRRFPRPGRQTWDLLVFVYFLSLKQCLRPLGYCAPLVRL